MGSASRVSVLLPIRTAVGQETVMPLILVRGAQPGPTLCITAGVHGAEYNGIETALRVAHDSDPSLLRGNLIVIPIVNVPAFETRSIYVGPHDGKNLNRVFPGRPDGTMSEVLAHVALGIVTGQAQYHVDLHAGDLVEAIVPMIFLQRSGIADRDQQAEELAAVYGPFNVVDVSTNQGWSGAGTFSATVQNLGVVSIAAETGGQGILDPECVAVQSQALRNVMVHLGMIEGSPAPATTQRRYPALVYLFAPGKGIFHPLVAVGDLVREGQEVATIASYLGETLHRVKSPMDGRVLVGITSLAVAEGGLLLGLGPERAG